MKITTAEPQDIPEILVLQKLAYQSEAELYQLYTIPPLIQTLNEIQSEFEQRLFLKAVRDGRIIGSVRAHVDGETCFIGRLIVHPVWQGQGTGTQLMQEIEARFPGAARFELFTGQKSQGNLRLYQRLGYQPFKQQVLNDQLTLVYLEKVT